MATLHEQLTFQFTFQVLKNAPKISEKKNTFWLSVWHYKFVKKQLLANVNMSKKSRHGTVFCIAFLDPLQNPEPVEYKSNLFVPSDFLLRNILL